MKILDIFKRVFEIPKPDNWKVVVLCIATATTFWLFNALNKNYDASIHYPVEWGYNPERYMVIEELPDRIQMNVSGLGWNLLRASYGVNTQPILIPLETPSLTKKLSGSMLSTQVSEALEGLQLNYIIDDTVRLNLDVIDKRSFPVYVDSASIRIEEGYKMISPVLYDEHLIELEGPQALLRSMPDSFFVAIPETEINSNFSEFIPFETEAPALFDVRPSGVSVAFEVRAFPQAEVAVPIQLTNFPENTNATLEELTTQITYTYQEDIPVTVDPFSFSVLADYNSINPLDSTLLLTLENYPDSIYDVRLSFPQVKVRYE